MSARHIYHVFATYDDTVGGSRHVWDGIVELTTKLDQYCELIKLKVSLTAEVKAPSPDRVVLQSISYLGTRGDRNYTYNTMEDGTVWVVREDGKRIAAIDTFNPFDDEAKLYGRVIACALAGADDLIAENLRLRAQYETAKAELIQLKLREAGL